MKIGRKIVKTGLIIFIAFFILAILFGNSIDDSVNTIITVGFYGMVIGKIIEAWEK